MRLRTHGAIHPLPVCLHDVVLNYAQGMFPWHGA